MTGDDRAPLRIGILGAARIVDQALIKPAAITDGVEVTAIAARNPGRAGDFARRHSIPVVHASYSDLLADSSIDAVYVPLPAALHAQWTIAAVQAGKDVLCEKPFTSNGDAAQQVADVAHRSDRIVMEAYHSSYHPLYARIRAILDSGELGRVVSAHAVFRIPIPPGKDIRWSLALGGGGLLDVGYYPARILTTLFGDNPEVVRAHALRRGDIDRSMDADLGFADGVTGTMSSAIWSARPLAMGFKVVGTEGKMGVTFPYHPHLGARIRVRGHSGSRTERTSRKSTYAYQLDAFANAARSRIEPPTNPDAAVSQARLLDEIYRKSGMTPRP